MDTLNGSFDVIVRITSLYIENNEPPNISIESAHDIEYVSSSSLVECDEKSIINNQIQKIDSSNYIKIKVNIVDFLCLFIC